MRCLFIIALLLITTISYSQKPVNPIIKSSGTVFEIPEAVELPDPVMKYKVVVDLQTANNDAGDLAYSLNNLARMINLHAVGKVMEMEVVGVIHSTSTKSVMNNEAYNRKYGTDNPNIALIKELHEKGVKLFVCGQSLYARDVDPKDVLPEIKIATAALTVLTTYQLRGFAHLRF